MLDTDLFLREALELTPAFLEIKHGQSKTSRSLQPHFRYTVRYKGESRLASCSREEFAPLAGHHGRVQPKQPNSIFILINGRFSVGSPFSASVARPGRSAYSKTSTHVLIPLLRPRLVGSVL